MAMKKSKASTRAKKKPAVKDLSAKSARAVKGGSVSLNYRQQKPDGPG